MTGLIKRQNSNTLPALFGWDAFDKLFADFEPAKFLDVPNFAYPTDVAEILDDNGEITGYEIDVTLAGIPKENVDVSIDHDTITISVDKTDVADEKNKRYIRKGISHRAMKFSYGLHGVDRENISADMKDGMLRVVLPKAEEAKPKQITIG